MLGAHRQTCPITEDPDPLPEGFFTDDTRKCEFFCEERTSGFAGLAFAIVLRAIEDGVNVEWLRLLSEFYEVRISDAFLARRPARRLRINQMTHRVDSSSQKIILSFFDFTPIRRPHLVRVA